jgi:hypothetical protein
VHTNSNNYNGGVIQAHARNKASSSGCRARPKLPYWLQRKSGPVTKTLLKTKRDSDKATFEPSATYLTQPHFSSRFQQLRFLAYARQAFSENINFAAAALKCNLENPFSPNIARYVAKLMTTQNSRHQPDHGNRTEHIFFARKATRE